jgi:hypothetical protein
MPSFAGELDELRRVYRHLKQAEREVERVGRLLASWDRQHPSPAIKVRGKAEVEKLRARLAELSKRLGQV